MLRSTVLALTVCTGFTGLAYEITWQKYLGDPARRAQRGDRGGARPVPGRPVARLLAVRRGSRAGSSSAAGSAAGRAPLLLVYGWIEAGIGLYCLAVPVALSGRAQCLGRGCRPATARSAFAVDVALAALLIVPPATLMGGTIPILTQALARDLEDATRVHALIYGWNTAGAFAGRARDRLLPDRLARARGRRCARWAGSTSLAGGVFALLEPAAARARRARARPERRRCAPDVFAVYGTVALLVGFAMMVLQTDRDPDRRPLVRLVGVHVRDGRRGVRAVHRAAAASPCRRARGSGASRS